ncbi:TadE/TadG family type IV pilus assembly protein [Microbacterium hatanonis]|uniref:TadE family protein n=1 Tax=Microbacterium hatanonis TaxID=404366 RepID=A0A5C8I580_9MICO|nr:TadE/TadG family type IV pilus assembly protein [Microbacterium hatanonis]TXK13371.1 TadE family protein [Microbacterium hatanonis]
MRRLRRALDDEEGSSPVEFVLVGGLLTLLTVAVLQLALAVYVRNVVHDAAVEGAFHAALADTSLADGAARTRDLIGRAVATSYAEDVTAVEHGETVRVTVRTTLPLLGLWGSSRALEVTADAPSESLG